MTSLSRTGVESYVNTYSPVNFVETGCFHGEAITYAKSLGVSVVYSCDMVHAHVNECRKMFPDATIHHGDSIEFLNRYLPTIEGDTLFWLDAHYAKTYDGGINETETQKYPMIEEINLIKSLKRGYEKDVVVCDDIRVIRDVNNPRYRADEVEDYYYVDYEYESLLNILSDTHEAVYVDVDEGVLIFKPK